MSEKDITEEFDGQMEEDLLDAEMEMNVESPETLEQDELTEEEQLREDLAKEKDKFLRLFAEFENFKRRTSKERMDMFKTAGQDIITSLLPVLDDFDRALRELAKSKDKDMFKGVELIRVKLRETLRSKGLEEVEVMAGDSFDAEVHDLSLIHI